MRRNRAGRLLAAFEARHAHQAADIRVLKLGQFRQQGFDLMGLKASFRRFAGSVTSSRIAACRPSSAAVSSMAFIIRILSAEWIIDANGSVAGLYSAEMTDHVPADGQIGKFLGPLPELLWPAFAQVGASGRNQGLDFRLAYVFGYCHQFNICPTPPAARRGSGDAWRTTDRFLPIRAEISGML